MSVEAITWALGQKVSRSSAKFVLVAMANCANNDLTCWPSIDYLAEATCQDRKTVLENIKRLKQDGYIADTEMRKGRTGQVPVYQLKQPENGTVEDTQKRNSTENGTVPKTDGNSTVFPSKQYRFSVETVPKTGHGTVKNRNETKGNRHKAPAPANTDSEFNPMATLLAAGVSKQTAKDWLKVRQAKKAPLTLTAWEEVMLEAGKAGITAAEAVRISAVNSWQGFRASWLDKAASGTVPNAAPANRQEALEARNRQVAAQLAGGSNG